MAQEPDLLISAGFSDAQLVKEANKVVAFYRQRGEEAQKAFQDAQGKVTNTAAVRAHQRELDRLSKAYDPVYRAARQYEDEVKRLDRALDVGAISQQQYTAKVEAAAMAMQTATRATQGAATGLQTSVRRADTSAAALGAGTQKAGRGMGELRHKVQNAAFQFQDFAVQVQAGTAVSVAAAQQLPQLLGGFGALGAVLGLVAAVAIPVGAALLNMGGAAKDVGESIDDLRTAIDDYKSAAENAATPTADLIEKYGRASIAARDLLEQVARLSRLDAAAALRDNAAALMSSFEGVESYLRLIDAEIREFGEGGAGLDVLADDLNAKFGLTIEQARELNQLLADAQAARSVEDRAAAIARVASFLDQAATAGGDSNAALLAGARAAAEGALNAYELSEAMRDSERAASGLVGQVRLIDFSGALSGAQTLSARISGMIGKAQELTAALGRAGGRQVSADQQAELVRVERSMIEAGRDRVAIEGELAVIRERQARANDGITTPALANAGLDDVRTIAEQTERDRKAIQDANKAAAEAEREAKKRAKEKKPDIFESASQSLTDAQRQIDLIGKTTVESAKMRAEWAMLDAAKKESIPVNDKLKAQITEQAEKVGELTGQLERGEIQQSRFEDAVDGVASSMSNLLLEGSSLRQGLAGIFKDIANDILTSGIKKALTSQFEEGGGFGGFLGSLFGAKGGGESKGLGAGVGKWLGSLFSFDGGGSTPRGPRSGGIDGRGGFPAILHPNEKVLDFTKGQTSSGGGSTFAPHFTIGGQVTQADIDKLVGAMRQLRGEVPAIMANHNKRNT